MHPNHILAAACQAAADIELQLDAVGSLAANGGEDLSTAGDDRMRAE